MDASSGKSGQRALRRGRVSEPGRAYLVTVATAARFPWFADFGAARRVVAEMRRLHEDGWLESLAWVVMPDHLHWLFMLGAADLGHAMNCFKGRSARSVNIMYGRSGALWQRAYHDHALRREEDLAATARYIVANPLRAGLVEWVGDYPHWDAAWLA